MGLFKLLNNHILQELDKRFEKLRENPESVGGKLCGPLHGYQSTRISRAF